MTVGYLADSFDLINVRDLDLIAQAGARCTRLVVGVFTDDYAERVSGVRPVVPLVERMAVLQHLRGVDHVVVHDPDSTGVAEDQLVFGVGDGPLASEASAPVLTPARTSASAILRNALSATDREAVA